MKASTAILKGFKKVNGRQCKGHNFRGGTPTNPGSVCVMGALALGLCGEADSYFNNKQDERAGSFINWFYHNWGYVPSDLNDDGMPWEDLYGMAVAAGL